MPPLGLCLLLLSADLDWQLGLRAETRGGEIPAGIDAANVAQAANVLDLELVPTAGLLLTGPQTRLILRYRPRLFWRAYESTATEDSAPLLLHQLDLIDRQQLAPRLLLDLTANAAYGEVERTAQPPGTNGAAIALARSFSYANASLQSQLTYRVTAVDSVSGALSGSTYVPLETGVATATQSFPSQYRGGLELGYTRALTPVDRLEASLSLELIVFDLDSSAVESPSFTTLGLEVGWRRRFTPRIEGRVEAGALLADDQGTLRVLPELTLGTELELVSERDYRWTASLAAGAAGFADPVRAQRQGTASADSSTAYVLRATATLNTALVVPPSFALRLAASFFTPLSDPPELPATPIPGTSRTPFVDETLASLRLSLGYQLVPEVQLELGLRASGRAPHLLAEEAGFREPELLGYFALTAAIDSGIRVARGSAGPG